MPGNLLARSCDLVFYTSQFSMTSNFFASIWSMLGESSGSTRSLLQFFNPSHCRLESRLMFEGKVTKLFPPRSSSSNEDKKPRLLRLFISSDKLQSLRSSWPHHSITPVQWIAEAANLRGTMITQVQFTKYINGAAMEHILTGLRKQHIQEIPRT